MSEHQELIAVITVLIAEQKRTTAAVEALLGQPAADQATVNQYEDIPAAIKEEMVLLDCEPTPEPETPTPEPCADIAQPIKLLFCPR